ncbi:regulatory protein RecX [bacterium]|nr:MAG: regulatory protein RecX [bacterium]
MRNNTDPLSEAKKYAFFLLKFRLRSEKEIASRLAKKKFSEAIISQVLEFLKTKNFISDEIFAKAWLESRLKKPLGLRRVIQELKEKGIACEIINDNISRIKEDYPEKEIVADIFKKRMSKIKGVDIKKAKARVYAYLLRRGFSTDAVMEAVNKS